MCLFAFTWFTNIWRVNSKNVLIFVFLPTAFLTTKLAQLPATDLWIGLKSTNYEGFYWIGGKARQYTNWGIMASIWKTLRQQALHCNVVRWVFFNMKEQYLEWRCIEVTVVFITFYMSMCILNLMIILNMKKLMLFCSLDKQTSPRQLLSKMERGNNAPFLWL